MHPDFVEESHFSMRQIEQLPSLLALSYSLDSQAAFLVAATEVKICILTKQPSSTKIDIIQALIKFSVLKEMCPT